MAIIEQEDNNNPINIYTAHQKYNDIRILTAAPMIELGFCCTLDVLSIGLFSGPADSIASDGRSVSKIHVSIGKK